MTELQSVPKQKHKPHKPRQRMPIAGFVGFSIFFAMCAAFVGGYLTYGAQALARAEIGTLEYELTQERLRAEIAKVRADSEALAEAIVSQAKAKAIEVTMKASNLALESKGKILSANPRLVDLTLAEKWSGDGPIQPWPGPEKQKDRLEPEPNIVKTVPIPTPKTP